MHIQGQELSMLNKETKSRVRAIKHKLKMKKKKKKIDQGCYRKGN